MIDLQYLSIILGALSFWVAAVYYVLNLREISRNRRITLTTTVLEPFMTKEGYGDLLDLLDMEWTDFEDFKNKYDHRVDPEKRRLSNAVMGGWREYLSYKSGRPTYSVRIGRRYPSLFSEYFVQ